MTWYITPRVHQPEFDWKYIQKIVSKWNGKSITDDLKVSLPLKNSLKSLTTLPKKLSTDLVHI